MTETNTQIACQKLLYANGLSEKDLSEAFSLLSGKSIDLCDFYFQQTISESFVIEEGILKNGHFSNDLGVGVRAFSGEKSALAYSDEISKDALLEAVKTIRAIGSSSENLVRVKINKEKQQKSLYINSNPIESKDTLAKIALVEKLENYARKRSPLVDQAFVYISSVYDVVLIARSDGLLVGDVRPLVRMGINVITQKDGNKEQGYSGGGGRFSLDFFTDEILQRYANEAVDAAVRNLDAKKSPAGVLPVVLGSGWPGVLFHEAVGHGLEADFHRKKSSVFTGKIGQKVASDNVTVIDDGSIPNRRGSLSVDDEGNPTSRTVLIENGILKGFMQDELNSRLLKMPVTGNGRRESFAHLPLPRMTNTYLMNGDLSPEEIISSVDYGIYATNFGGGQVDITSGNFVFSMNEAWLIEKGKITSPIKGATLNGNGADALLKIKLIGNDLCLDSGVGICGKEGQQVPTGVGMPTIRIDGLTVGGTTA